MCMIASLSLLPQQSYYLQQVAQLAQEDCAMHVQSHVSGMRSVGQFDILF